MTKFQKFEIRFQRFIVFAAGSAILIDFHSFVIGITLCLLFGLLGFFMKL